MTRDHSLIEELLSAQALGSPDPADRALLDRIRSEHGDCAECAALESAFDEVAASLATSLDPVPVREGMVDEILSIARPAAAPVEPAGAEPISLERERGGRRGGGWRAIIAVAAAFALFAGGFFVRDLTGSEPGAPTFVRFSGDAGTLAMAYRPGESGAVLFGSGLPDPGAGNVYEIWTITGQTPVPQGCVSPSEGEVLTYVDTNVESADLMAVTVEPASCPPAPTSDPVLTASLA